MKHMDIVRDLSSLSVVLTKTSLQSICWNMGSFKFHFQHLFFQKDSVGEGSLRVGIRD